MLIAIRWGWCVYMTSVSPHDEPQPVDKPCPVRLGKRQESVQTPGGVTAVASATTVAPLHGIASQGLGRRAPSPCRVLSQGGVPLHAPRDALTA
jgi:hypothetical protein